MWKITRDLIDGTEVGRQTKNFDEKKAIHKFRLLDDDKTVYYYGLADTNDDEKAFKPLDYYQTHSGCTEIQFKNNGKWETL